MRAGRGDVAGVEMCQITYVLKVHFKGFGLTLGEMEMEMLRKRVVTCDSHVNNISLAAAHLGLCGAITIVHVDMGSPPCPSASGTIR